ncbi:MAG: Na+/H+ antiporter NhaA [Bdellovibrionales bacterium]
MFKKLKNILGSFLNIESTSGILLFGLAGLAFYMANSEWNPLYHAINHFSFVFSLGTYTLKTNLHEIINEVLMAIFFFVVGMEIKRELTEGEFSTPKKAALPLLAAIGGSVIPAAIYYFFNRDLQSELGWGIPMATDIAFALGILSLLSRRVPFALKMFLLGLAIIDDILAVLVIALFYSGNISEMHLMFAAVIALSIFLYFDFNFNNSFVLVALSMLLWFCVYQSGIHATLSGVVLGFLIPYRRKHTRGKVLNAIKKAFTKGQPDPSVYKIKELQSMIYHTKSTLNHFINKYHPLSSYVILPLFAFSNAGISLKSINLQAWMNSPISYGIILGLCLGKPIGITLFSFGAYFFKIAKLPKGISWRQIIGVGFLGGIGFTMSLFITNLSFTVFSTSHHYAKLSIAVSSVFCALLGLILLSFGKKEGKTR